MPVADPEADPSPGDGSGSDPDETRAVVTPWAGFAAVLLGAQSVASVALLTLSPAAVPTALPGSVVAVGVFAAAAVGVDARGTRGEWSPTPLAWAAPVLAPCVGAGVLLAYLGRRLQTVRPAMARLWVWPAVGASVVSGVAIYGLGVVGFSLLTLPVSATPATAVTFVVNLVAVGLSVPAAYFDTRAVDRRLSAAGRDWRLRGSHWVVALSVPVPLRAPLALVYLLWRRRVLRGTGAALDDKT